MPGDQICTCASTIGMAFLLHFVIASAAKQSRSAACASARDCFVALRASRNDGWSLQFPPQPVAQAATHDQFEVGALEPGKFFGEQRHALLPRNRHAGDVGAPEIALGSE